MNFYKKGIGIEEDIKDLSNPELDFKKHRKKVNELVFNLVTKYTARYLNINPNMDFDKISREVDQKVREKDVNISEILQQFAGGGFGKSDVFAVQCLSDALGTSAIVKEIIFKNNETKNKEAAVNYDLGTGSGILLLAAHINSVRNGYKQVLNLGFESQSEAIDNSNEILGSLLGQDKAIVQRADIRSEGLYRYLSEKGHPNFLNNWISETISYTTPEIKEDGTSMKNAEDAFYFLFNDLSGDPFARVIENTVKHIPDFVKRVKDHKVLMFPDLVNGHYKPNERFSTISLQTSPNPEHLTLSKISHEFVGYPKLQHTHERWY